MHQERMVVYEIRAGDMVITVTDTGGNVTAAVSPPAAGGIEVKVTRSGEVTRAAASSGSSMTFAMPLASLIDQSDLAESDKREARALVQRLRLRPPTLAEINALLTIFEKSEGLRTQVLQVLRHVFNV